ncbi:hypothetical protein [Sinomonas flava]|uniref:hypothetical protein n=1 Tax=Sinomonas flava TaxID=496857 RepID=UPI0039A4CB64
MTITQGPLLTSPREYKRTDYFVRRTGAAQNEAGFHRYLADFLGLKLPQVTRTDGGEGILYLETLFPYFFVEQKHGWSGIQARIPMYLGIRDVGKRSAEYILGLEVFERTLRRQRIRSAMSELEAEWRSQLARLTEVARNSQLVLKNIPRRISQGISEDELVASLAVDGRWVSIEEATITLSEQLRTFVSNPVPLVGESSTNVEADLQRLDQALRQSLAVAASLADEKTERERQRVQVVTRLEALREDLERHKDSEVLERLGSELDYGLIAEHVCPTCHQHLEDGADISQHAMTIAESIAFIKRQIVTFEGVQSDHERVIEALDVRQQNLASEIRDYRAGIRAARETLVAANSAPSVVEIAHRIKLENRISELEQLSSQMNSARNSLASVASKWVELREVGSQLEKGDLSESDRSKIGDLQRSIQAQLRSYGFTSVDAVEVEIDSDTYRPVHQGFDLGFDLSASDMIRLIWAYLFGILEVGREASGNHLGLLIFDEPRQQETAHASYGALLAWASRAGQEGSQILFATSEPLDTLNKMLIGRTFNLINLAPGEKLLQPV